MSSIAKANCLKNNRFICQTTAKLQIAISTSIFWYHIRYIDSTTKIFLTDRVPIESIFSNFQVTIMF